jgi:hypothetical protein
LIDISQNNENEEHQVKATLTEQIRRQKMPASQTVGFLPIEKNIFGDKGLRLRLEASEYVKPCVVARSNYMGSDYWVLCILQLKQVL